MKTVLTIAPVCGRPSLLAFVCSGCGGTKSDLIYPEHWQVNQAVRRQDAALDSAVVR
jgi:hypothetical protein